MSKSLSLVRSISQIGTLIFTFFYGVRVGCDSQGNRYYRSRRGNGRREKRWVMYAGEPDSSRVPPEWFTWLRHSSDKPLDPTMRYNWQKEYVPNATGTPDAWLPSGKHGHGRQRATGDIEPWIPNTIA